MYENINVIGRVIFGLYFAYSGFNHFKNGKGMAGYAAMKKVPMPLFMVYFSGLLVLLGGLGVMFGVYYHVSLFLILLFLIPVSVFMHDFWNDADPQTKMNNMVGFMKNVALIGAAMAMF